MVSLGEAFPEELRRQTAERSIEEGSVIRLFDEEADKDKRHLIVGFDKDKILVATLRINSEINKYYYDTEELKALHHPLKANEENFLDHDSFVACDKLNEWENLRLVELVTKNPSMILGEISDVKLDVIRSMVADSPSIPPKYVKKYNL